MSIINTSNSSFLDLPNELLVVILSNKKFDAIDLAKTSKVMLSKTLKAETDLRLKCLHDFRIDIIQNLDPENKTQIAGLKALVFRFSGDIPNFVRLRQLVDRNLENIVDALQAVGIKELADLSVKRNDNTFIHTEQLYPYYYYSVFRDAGVCKALANQDLFLRKPYPFAPLPVDSLTDFGIIGFGDVDGLVRRVVPRYPIDRLITIATRFNEETQLKLVEKYCAQSTDRYESGAIDKLFDFALNFSNPEMKSRALRAVSSSYARIGQLFKARVIASSIPDEAEREKAWEFVHSDFIQLRHPKESLKTDEIKPVKFHSNIGIKFFSF